MDYFFIYSQTRENFDETRQKAQELKNKYMDSKMKPDSEYTKQGYLYLMEKSKLRTTYNTSILDSVTITTFTAEFTNAFLFGFVEFAVVTWSKYYCTYKKQSREFSMLQYNQMSGRSVSVFRSIIRTGCFNFCIFPIDPFLIPSSCFTATNNTGNIHTFFLHSEAIGVREALLF